MAKRIALVVGLVILARLVLEYLSWDESKKHYYQNLVRQVPDMPGRYFV